MNGVFLRTCVSPSGTFVYGIHKPAYKVINLREKDYITLLGHISGETAVDNKVNFPADDVNVDNADWVFEVSNPFPFMGATFILKSNADRHVKDANPFRFNHERESTLLRLDDFLEQVDESDPFLVSLGRTSIDPNILMDLANISCRFEFDPDTGDPVGIQYKKTEEGRLSQAITNRHLFEIVSNNPFLPDPYKQAMVLIPGIQGTNKIVGEYKESPNTHVWEYLRDNSYIPWGHYASNMAHDAIRYKIGALQDKDMIGLRHLYYQRVYTQLAHGLGIALPARRRTLTEEELGSLRTSLREAIKQHQQRNKTHLPFNACLWGWNFGFDLSPSGYRLNASHQQIHQQFALIPQSIPGFSNGENKESHSSIPTYIQGDDVALFCRQFKNETGKDFFEAYLAAIQNNQRMDGEKDRGSSLVFYQDENVMAFVPKAQRSHGEVQIITTTKCGNILEADSKVRRSLDLAILTTVRVLEGLGVEMMIAYEISKRFDDPSTDQRLMYIFLPKHPQSPGTLSEWQYRWITGHYPEDFAYVCRKQVEQISN
ncbi:MAG: hypothetical protein ABIF87_02750 [Pseudomonadota bacterium]